MGRRFCLIQEFKARQYRGYYHKSIPDAVSDMPGDILNSIYIQLFLCAQ